MGWFLCRSPSWMPLGTPVKASRKHRTAVPFARPPGAGLMQRDHSCAVCSGTSSCIRSLANSHSVPMFNSFARVTLRPGNTSDTCNFVKKREQSSLDKPGISSTRNVSAGKMPSFWRRTLNYGALRQFSPGFPSPGSLECQPALREKDNDSDKAEFSTSSRENPHKTSFQVFEIERTQFSRVPLERDDTLGYCLEFFEVLKSFVHEAATQNMGLIIFIS